MHSVSEHGCPQRRSFSFPNFCLITHHPQMTLSPDVLAARLCDKGKVLVVGTRSGKLHPWDIHKNAEIDPIDMGRELLAMGASVNSNRVGMLLRDASTTLVIYDLERGAIHESTLDGFELPNPMTSVELSMSPRGGTAVVIDGNRNLHLLRLGDPVRLSCTKCSEPFFSVENDESPYKVAGSNPAPAMRGLTSP